ncbi:MAG: hypothetical protein Q9194_005082 [Teloschistes cf. exilis]
MCERAFPPDRAIATAIRNSQRTAYIETVQNGANEYNEQLAAAHAQVHQDRPADITDVGLDDPPPDYHTSSRDRRLDARRWTTSDYRREQPGYRKEISPEIREIMRLYGELKAYLKFIEPPDSKGEKMEREKQERLLLLPQPPPSTTPADGSVVVTSRKGKGKETDDDDDAAAQIPPPEIADSLDDIFRPGRCAEVGGTPSASARNYAANLPTAAARQRAMEQQSHSAAISASRLPNSRSRRPKAWEPQVERFGRLAIMEEEDEEEPQGRAEDRMSKGTARRVRQDRNYRRSGI